MARRSKNAFLEGLGAGFGQSFAKSAAYDPEAKLRKEAALLEYRDKLLKMGYTGEEADQAIDAIRRGKSPNLPTARAKYLDAPDLAEGQSKFLDGGERISTLEPIPFNTDALYVRDQEGRLIRKGNIPKNRVIEDPFTTLSLIDPGTGEVETSRIPKGQVRVKPRPASGGPQETPEEKAQRQLNMNMVKLYQKRINDGELLTDEDIVQAQTAAEALGGRFEEVEIEKDGFFGKKKVPTQRFVFDEDNKVMGVDMTGKTPPAGQKRSSLAPAPKAKVATREILLKEIAAVKMQRLKAGQDVSSPAAIKEIRMETEKRLKQQGYTGL